MSNHDKPNGGNAPALILFGKKKAKRPIAVWFRAKDADLAQWVARRQRLSMIRADTTPARGMIKSLPEWQFEDDGPAVVPIVKQELYDQLQAFAAEQSAFDGPPAEGETPVLSDQGVGPASDTRLAQLGDQLWDELATGRLVLAAELDRKGQPDGWSEAVILAIQPRGYILHWRDFPEDGLIWRPRQLIALLYPIHAA